MPINGPREPVAARSVSSAVASLTAAVLRSRMAWIAGPSAFEREMRYR